MTPKVQNPTDPSYRADADSPLSYWALSFEQHPKLPPGNERAVIRFARRAATLAGIGAALPPVRKRGDERGLLLAHAFDQRRRQLRSHAAPGRRLRGR